MERVSRNTINTLHLYRYGSDTHYWDYISPNYAEATTAKPHLLSSTGVGS
jgi:hypothetical protein